MIEGYGLHERKEMYRDSFLRALGGTRGWTRGALAGERGGGDRLGVGWDDAKETAVRLQAEIERAGGIVGRAGAVAVLTGAGVSAESGVPTFREMGGLWEQYRVEEVATPEAFERDPELVWRFYNARRRDLAQVQPNPGHHALADLESLVPGFTLITQNIDGLHRRAGSRRVLAVHGDLGQVRCTGCGQVEDRAGQHLPDRPTCGRCQGLLRPNVVWFGETLPEAIWEQAVEATATADAFLIVGTSAQVQPAAGLAWQARSCGAAVIEVNVEPTPATQLAQVSLVGRSGDILPRLVDAVRARVRPGDP